MPRLHPNPVNWEIKFKTITLIDRTGKQQHNVSLARTIRSLNRDNGLEEFLVLVEEPTQQESTPKCKIYTKTQLLDRKKQQEMAEKVGIRKSRAEKEIDLNWSIREHDLVWSLKKIKEWLEDGKRVSVSLKRKRKKLETDVTECMELIGKIRDTVKSVRGTSETSVEGKLGLAMVLEFQAKDKRYQDQGLKIPWEINDKALSAQIQVMQGALKKGKSVTVELGTVEGDERRPKLPRQEVLQRVRSAYRQVKDAIELKSSGGLESAMTLELEGKYNGKRRELELPWGMKDSDLKIRLRWISDWIAAGKEVKLYLGEKNDEISSQFTWDKLHLELYGVRSVHPSMTVREEGSLILLDPVGKQKEERQESIGAHQ